MFKGRQSNRSRSDSAICADDNIHLVDSLTLFGVDQN